ncbi:MAG: hypothetical protein U0R52_04615 [Solirubrobacterales bacterium]
MWDPGHRFLKAWMLPLIVAGLVLPGAVGMLVGGPGIGVAAGEMCALVIVVVAAMQRPDEPIEIAPATDSGGHLLLLAGEPVDEPGVVEGLLGLLEERPSPPAEILVVAPARASALSQWLSDVEPAREEAQVRLVHSLAGLAAAGLDARGQVGDGDLLQAAEDALRSFPATDVVLVHAGHDRATGRAAEELRRRLRVPLTELAAAPAAHPG